MLSLMQLSKQSNIASMKKGQPKVLACHVGLSATSALTVRAARETGRKILVLKKYIQNQKS